MLRSFQNCERSAWTAERSLSNSSIGVPPGLAAVFGISGGTALISTALATRWVPCLPRYRATSPPPVGVTNVNGISQVKRFDQRGQIIGVRVHLVSVPGLPRSGALRFQEGQ